MTHSTLSIKIIAGSTREGRFSDKAAAWVATVLRKNDGVETEVVDLRDYDMPFFDNPESPAFKSTPYTHEAVVRFTKKIAEADAYIIVTPEYNHSMPGVLKNAMDWVYQEWGDKPIGFVSYGSVGGARVVEHLRLVAIELHMAPIREAVHMTGNDYFPVVMGKSAPDELFTKYEAKVEILAKQLLKWAHALKTIR